jgi:hypothetical protein
MAGLNGVDSRLGLRKVGAERREKDEKNNGKPKR